MSTKKNIRTNLIGGILFAVLSVVLLLIIPREIVQSYQDNQFIAADTIPKLIGWLTLAISGWLIVSSLVLKKEDVRAYEVKPELMAIGFIGILILYVVLINVLGFFFSSLLLVCATMAYEKVRSVKLWVIVLATTIAIYLVFAFGLDLMFPTLF